MNKQFTATVTLKSSVAHNGDTVGIDAVFHRIKMLGSDGQPMQVPTITGNSIRGLLRDASARYMLHVMGTPDVPLSAFYLLFSGGSLTKKGSPTTDIDAIRTMRATIPHLALFGGAIGRNIMSGRLKMEMMIPIALETAHINNTSHTPDNLVSMYDLMQTEAYTRTDDAKNDDLAQYIGAPQASGDDAPMQMRYQVETMAAGSQLTWGFALDFATELDEQCLIAALRQWGQYPTIGGKSSVGHGHVSIDFNNGWHISQDHLNLPDTPDYDQHLRDNADAIMEMLSHV